MHRVPDLLLGLDMRASLAKKRAWHDAYRGSVRSLLPRTALARPSSYADAHDGCACRSRDLLFSFCRAKAGRRQFTTLLIYGERNQIIHRSSAMCIAGHNQAESLIFHRLAVPLIRHDHLFAGKTRIDFTNRERHAVTVMATRQDCVLQWRTLVAAAVHRRGLLDDVEQQRTGPGAGGGAMIGLKGKRQSHRRQRLQLIEGQLRRVRDMTVYRKRCGLRECSPSP